MRLLSTLSITIKAQSFNGDRRRIKGRYSRGAWSQMLITQLRTGGGEEEGAAGDYQASSYNLINYRVKVITSYLRVRCLIKWITLQLIAQYFNTSFNLHSQWWFGRGGGFGGSKEYFSKNHPFLLTLWLSWFLHNYCKALCGFLDNFVPYL